eukprot:m.56292 g.56292  ORF g.56292 m.56292 type:complete len:505 (+) comp11029_c0_seq2:202-1716(+)
MDEYLLVVLGGLENVAARRVARDLSPDTVNITVLSPDITCDGTGYMVNTKTPEDGKANSAEPNRYHYGVPCCEGQAGCGKLLLRTNANPARVQSLSCVQCVLAFVHATDPGVPVEHLLDIQQSVALDAILRVTEDISIPLLNKSLALWERHMEIVGSDEVKEALKTHGSVLQNSHVSMRASCVRDGKHSFKSVDASPVLAGVLLKKFPWRVQMIRANLEIVAIILHGHVCIGLVLTPNVTFKNSTLPTEFQQKSDQGASYRLRPSTTQLLLSLATEFSKGNSLGIVVDPCAGENTIPDEAIAMHPKRFTSLAIGGEIDSSVHSRVAKGQKHWRRGQDLQCTKAEYMQWNACRLPLRSNCADCVISDLPFGLHCLNSREVAKIYPRIVKEASRILVLGGILILMTALNGPKLLCSAINSMDGWYLISNHATDKLSINVGGIRGALVMARWRGIDVIKDLRPFPVPQAESKRQKKMAAKQKYKELIRNKGIEKTTMESSKSSDKSF